MNDFMERYNTLLQMQNPNQQGGAEAPHMPNMPSPHYNPISRGSEEAMKAARHSTSLDDGQARRSVGVMLMNLAANMGTPHPGTGVAGMLGAVNQGMNPAVQAYMGQINHFEDSNRKLLAQQMQLEAQQRREFLMEREFAGRLMHDEEKQQFLERQLNADIAYKNKHLDLQRQRYGQESRPTVLSIRPGEDIDVSSYSNIASKSQENFIARSKKMADTTGSLINRTLKKAEGYRKKYSKDTVREDLPWYMGGPAVRGAKDIVGIAGNKRYAQQRRDRIMLENDLKQLRTISEKASKGGVPGAQMMKEFEQEGILPHFDQGVDIAIDKLKEMKHDFDMLSKSDEYSLKTKKVITPKDVESWMTHAEEKPQAKGGLSPDQAEYLKQKWGL